MIKYYSGQNYEEQIRQLEHKVLLYRRSGEDAFQKKQKELKELR